MIIAQQKPMEEIFDKVKDYNRILVAGCNTCVAVCMAGGEKETGIVASALRIFFNNQGKKATVEEITVERQCEEEFVNEMNAAIKRNDIILSLACGVGVQTIAEYYKDKLLAPGVNTKFMGRPTEIGAWAERCGGCGDCVLDLTGGVCPIARCSKSLLNGPCGGSQDGKCEVADDIDCGWQLIYDRLKTLGKLDNIYAFHPVKDWTTSRDGGVRKVVRDDVVQGGDRK